MRRDLGDGAAEHAVLVLDEQSSSCEVTIYHVRSERRGGRVLHLTIKPELDQLAMTAVVHNALPRQIRKTHGDLHDAASPM